MTTLNVNIDGIIIIADDLKEMKQLKRHLNVEFEIKDLKRLKYLGIDIAHSRKGIFTSQ